MAYLAIVRHGRTEWNRMARGESLADVMARVRPWLAEAREAAAASGNVVAFTHGTTFRAIRALIEGVAPEGPLHMRPANGSLEIYEMSHHRPEN